MLDRDLSGLLVEGGIGLDKHLARLLVLEYHVPKLGAPEIRLHRCHVLEELPASLHVGRGLVYVQLLQVLAHSVPANRQDLGSIKLNGQIRQVVVLVIELAEVVSGLEEALDKISG